MQVTSTNTPIEFQPFQIHLTIESKEELIILTNMFGMNLSIPHLLFSNDPVSESKLIDMMQFIANELHKHNP